METGTPYLLYKDAVNKKSRGLKQLVSEWVNGGAPLGVPGGQDGEVDLKPTWVSLSKKVFFPKCVMCHNPRGEASFLDLSDRQKFFENRVELLNNFEDVRKGTYGFIHGSFIPYNENQPSGAHTATWNARDFSNGIYFYTLSVNGNVASDKIVINR